MSGEKLEKSNSYVSKIPIRKSVGKLEEERRNTPLCIQDIKLSSTNIIGSLKIKSCPLKSTEKLSATIISRENRSLEVAGGWNSEESTLEDLPVDDSVTISNSEDGKLKSSGKGDLKRKRTYTVSNEFKEENSETEVIAEGGDAKQISIETKNKTDKSCEVLFFKEQTPPEEPEVERVSPSRLSRFQPLLEYPSNEPTSIEVYPQVLIFIPNIEKPGVFTSNFNIANKTSSLLAYKICGNHSAVNHYTIVPTFGVLDPQSEMQIKLITQDRVSKNEIGGFSQFRAARDVLEIRALDTFAVKNDMQFFKFWKIAEVHHSDLITSVRISNIQVLEPCNQSILRMIEEGPERDFLQNYLREKYENEIVPQMMKNRNNMKKKQNLVMMSGRLANYWQRTNIRDKAIDCGFLTLMIFSTLFYMLPRLFEEPVPQEIPPESYFRWLLKAISLSQESTPNSQQSQDGNGNAADTESFSYAFLNLFQAVAASVSNVFAGSPQPSESQ